MARRPGRITFLFEEIARSLFRRKIVWGDLIYQLHFIGVKSQSVVLITGAFTGMVLAAQTYFQFHKVKMDTATLAVVSVSMCSELGPVLTALMVAGRVGAAAGQGVEHGVQGQVLGGGDVDLLRPAAGRAGEPPGGIQERDRPGQELLPLRGERRPPPRAALLAVQRHPEPVLQFDQAVPQPLLGDVGLAGGVPQAAPAGEFDEGGHLVGRDGGHAGLL